MKLELTNDTGWVIECPIHRPNPASRTTDEVGSYRLHIADRNRDDAVANFATSFLRVFNSTAGIIPGFISVTPADEAPF